MCYEIRFFPFFLVVLLTSANLGAEGLVVTVDRNDDSRATGEFKFERVPSPVNNDAANGARIRIVQGIRDRNGGEVRCLQDSEQPTSDDEPRKNLFFRAGSNGGRLIFEFEKPIDVEQVNTFSWHKDVRAGQVYTLYGFVPAEGSDGQSPAVGGDLIKAGWSLLATVDTRSKEQLVGGQFGVSIAAQKGKKIGTYRFLLFDIATTETDDPFGHTFFSEIDILDGKEYPPLETDEGRTVLKIDDKYEIAFDTSDLPEIRPWVEETLIPVCKQWYPNIVEMLPSENFQAPQKFKIIFHRDMEGVANTAGTQVNCAGNWFLRNLNGEAAGAVVHELVHVVQQYGRVRGGNRNPGWLVEGVADQVRWFLYEPADQRPRVNPARAKYTDSYRTTAAFLDFVAKKHDPEIVKKLNADMRQGKYDEALWKKYTGKSVDELWEEFVTGLRN